MAMTYGIYLFEHAPQTGAKCVLALADLKQLRRFFAQVIFLENHW